MKRDRLRTERKEEVKEKESEGIKAVRSGNVTAVKVSRQIEGKVHHREMKSEMMEIALLGGGGLRMSSE
jgi:hypothetical protein